MRDVAPAALKEELQRLCPELLFELVPKLRKETKRLYAAPNPQRSETGDGSFKVWPNGAWKEFDDDGIKGDLLDLIAFVGGHAPKSREGRAYALGWAKKRLGIESRAPKVDAATKAKMDKEKAEKRAAAEREEARAAMRKHLRVIDIWQGAKMLCFDPPDLVTLYLRSRGIDISAIPRLIGSNLRLHPRLVHWTSSHMGPAMITRVFRPGVETYQAVHCTWLKENGSGKADVVPAKMMLGAVKGGVVPLTRGASGLSLDAAAAAGISEPVIVGEGNETMLAVASAEPDGRVWAALSLGNIGEAPVDHPAVSAIVVCLENDVKPQALRLREAVLEKLRAHGKPVIEMRPHAGSDFAELLEEEL